MVRSDHEPIDWLQPPGEQQGLKRYLQTIRERIWLVIGVVVVTTAAAVIYVSTADKVYEADADVLVVPTPGESTEAIALGLIPESSDPLRVVETAAALIETHLTADRAAEMMGGGDADAILDDVSVQPLAESNIVTVTAEGSSPERAADLANAFARAAIDVRTEALHQRIDEELPRLQERLAELPPGFTRDTLTASIGQLETLRAADDPTLQVAEPATEPSGPSWPRRNASIAAGILAGLVLGIGGAFALTVLDPRLRREEQLRDLYRLPILARVPRERTRRSEPLAWDRLSAGSIEAYRMLRAVLARPLARSAGSGSFLVTSAEPSEGKTTTAINLATSLALTGKRVILIEADLRRPSIGDALGITVDRGVISVLIEEATLAEALTTSRSGHANLSLLLAEQAGVWGSELLSLPAAQRLIDEAKLLADFVVVDSPPLATVVDALPLARTADEVLLVVRLGETKLTRLHELAELLADTGIKPAGFAVIGVARTRETYYRDYRRRLVTDGDEAAARELARAAARESSRT